MSRVRSDWEGLPAYAEIRRFELTSDMVAGKATAKMLFYISDSDDYQKEDRIIRDVFSIDPNFIPKSGTKVFAKKWSDSGRWEILSLTDEDDPCLLWCFVPGTSVPGDDAIDSVQGLKALDIGLVGRFAGPKYDFSAYNNTYFNTTYRNLGLHFDEDFTFTCTVNPDILGVDRNFIFSTNALELYITGSGDTNPTKFEVGWTDSDPTSFKTTDLTTVVNVGQTYKISVRWNFVDKAIELRVDGNSSFGSTADPLLDSTQDNVAFGRSIDYTDDELDGQVEYFKWYCSLLTDEQVDAETSSCGCCAEGGSDGGTGGSSAAKEQRSELYSLSRGN